MQQSISMKKAAVYMIGSIAAVIGIGTLIGYTFFWNQYDSASSSEKKAEALMEETIADPKNEESKLQLAWAYYEQGNARLAKEQFNAIIQQNKKNLAASYGLAVVLNEEKRYGEAEKILTAIHEAASDDSQVLHELGIAQRGQKMYEEAEETLRHALQLEPLSADLHYDTGLLYENMKDYETAIVHYQKSIDLVPDFTASIEGLKRLGIEKYEPKKFH